MTTKLHRQRWKVSWFECGHPVVVVHAALWPRSILFCWALDAPGIVCNTEYTVETCKFEAIVGAVFVQIRRKRLVHLLLACKIVSGVWYSYKSGRKMENSLNEASYQPNYLQADHEMDRNQWFRSQSIPNINVGQHLQSVHFSHYIFKIGALRDDHTYGRGRWSWIGCYSPARIPTPTQFYSLYTYGPPRRIWSQYCVGYPTPQQFLPPACLVVLVDGPGAGEGECESPVWLDYITVKNRHWWRLRNHCTIMFEGSDGFCLIS